MSRREFLKAGAEAFLALALRDVMRRSPLPLSERIKLLTDPSFFTSSINSLGEPPLVSQLDGDQYAGLELKTNIEYIKNNSCGWAVIATLLRAITCLNGENKKFTIADIMNLTDARSATMTDQVMNRTLKTVGENTGLFTVVDDLAAFHDPAQIIPFSLWNNIFKLAEQKVVSKAGLLVLRVLKYGKRPIEVSEDVQSHFIVISGSRRLILDSRGGEGNMSRVVTTPLINYCQDYYGEPGLLSIQGVIPVVINTLKQIK